MRLSPVHGLLGEPVVVTQTTLRQAREKRSFSPIAYELYKETVAVLAVCLDVRVNASSESPGQSRKQAICSGLLVRVAKFMKGVAILVSQDPDSAHIVHSLNRSILESATNLRFLVRKAEDKYFERFVKFSLGPEREARDMIEKNVDKRDGSVLPIEQRMLDSIDRVCGTSGMAISDVPPKSGDWGGGLRTRMAFLGEGDLYAFQQRIGSHAVHGTWVDLVFHHLKEVDNGFVPDPTGSRVDSRLMLPVCLIVLRTAEDYVKAFFPPLPELLPLLERITDLTRRIKAVEAAHEKWLSARGDSLPATAS